MLRKSLVVQTVFLSKLSVYFDRQIGWLWVEALFKGEATRDKRQNGK